MYPYKAFCGLDKGVRIKIGSTVIIYINISIRYINISILMYMISRCYQLCNSMDLCVVYLWVFGVWGGALMSV